MSKLLLALVALASLTVFAHAQSNPPTTQRATQPGKLRYKLVDGNENWPPQIRDRIVAAMDGAVSLYNEVGTFDKQLTVSYSPGTPTADANYNGHIRFGGQIGKRTALHEIGHTLGVGTTRQWRELLIEGKWTGPNAIALLKSFDGPDAVLKGDRQHFWPYGLNYDKESSPENDRRHVLMVRAFRVDMGFDAAEE
jgi:hypothetical protein